MATKDLTAQRLRQLLHYDADTGHFTWLVIPGHRVKVGDRAGYYVKDGYRKITVDGLKCLEHQLAWLYSTGRWGEPMIDHINGVHDDNRIGNLREVSNRVNMQNQRRPRADNASGVLGVRKHPRADRWVARIKHLGREIHLGCFRSKTEAHEAYLKAKRVLHVGCTL